MIVTHQKRSENIDIFLAKLLKYTDARELTPEIIWEFINRIEVYKPE